MSCTTLTSISRSCDGNIGGIREVYLWDMEDVITQTEDPNTWTITTLVAGGTAGVAPASYQFTRESSNYTEELAADFVNGSSVWTATLNLMFTRREALKSKSIKILGEGQRYLGALVKDENGNYWVFNDLQLSASAEGSGTTKEDGSKYSVTLVGKTAYPAYGIGATAATNFIADGSSN